jgi:hypothetical protein
MSRVGSRRTRTTARWSARLALPTTARLTKSKSYVYIDRWANKARTAIATARSGWSNSSTIDSQVHESGAEAQSLGLHTHVLFKESWKHRRLLRSGTKRHTVAVKCALNSNTHGAWLQECLHVTFYAARRHGKVAVVLAGVGQRRAQHGRIVLHRVAMRVICPCVLAALGQTGELYGRG